MSYKTKSNFDVAHQLLLSWSAPRDGVVLDILRKKVLFRLWFFN